ncbi:MAG: mycothiol conjugate amidase Mca [Actinomycetales bacterium]
MAVHAHPDDEASKGAATTARYVQEGVEVMVVTCTGGERGDVLHDVVQEEVQVLGLAEVRRREMAASAKILGIQHAWLGFEDSGYPQGDPLPPVPDGCFAALPLELLTPGLVTHIRDFRPHVLTTYDERGGYPHPDHVQCHRVSMAAVELAADPMALPEAGPAWQVLKIYYNQQFTKARVQALHLAMIDADLESPYHDWLRDWDDEPVNRVTTRIHAAPWFPIRDAALRAHRSQISEESPWFSVPQELQARIWPTEDFELAYCAPSVAVSREPGEFEEDLFFGLRT